jgi:hypothetical protein
MAASTISATEDFLRPIRAAVEDHRPIGPVTRTILETLLTETASHVGRRS